MSFPNLIFYVVSVVLIGGAVGVITARNPVHAVLFLVFTFFNSAIVWLLMDAEFLAIVLMLVYVGAVMVLFLFVVMMLDVDVAQLREGFNRYAPIGALVALVVIAEIASVVWVKGAGLDLTAQAPAMGADYSNTRALGQLLYTEYLYPLELAAVILLVAIVAAIVLTMRHRTGYKTQDISKQVAVRARDRVRVIKMDAEKQS